MWVRVPPALPKMAKKKKMLQKPDFTLGFTGRREGWTDPQREKLEKLLEEFLNGHTVLCLHNDGEGADQLFGRLAKKLGGQVETTPSNLGHMPRNRHLVAACDVLVALPPTDDILKRGSGTWETIKYMWKKPGDVCVILSDGTVKHHKIDFS